MTRPITPSDGEPRDDPATDELLQTLLTRLEKVERLLRRESEKDEQRLRRHHDNIMAEFDRLHHRAPTAVRDAIVNSRVELGRLDYDNTEILMRLGTSRTVQRLRSCQKEPWTVDWLETYLRGDDVLYDIGANVGAYTLVAACKDRPPATVVAIEPSAPTFAVLCENLAINSVDHRVVPLQVLLGRETGLLHFQYRDYEAGSASHVVTPNRKARLDFTPVLRQRVPCYPLDAVPGLFGLPWPTHLKLDVDGGELDVLAGAHEALLRVTSVMLELRREQATEVDQVLRGAGLEMAENYIVEKEPGEDRDYGYALYTRSANA